MRRDTLALLDYWIAAYEQRLDLVADADDSDRELCTRTLEIMREQRRQAAQTGDALTDALTVATVADLLGITETALRVRISDGRFPSQRVGRMRVIPVHELEHWLWTRELEAREEARRLAGIRERVSHAPRAIDQ